MKNLILIFAFFALLSIANDSYSQSGWSSSNWYAYRGDVRTTCGPVYVKYGYDQFGLIVRLGCYQWCKTTVWHQEWREGWVCYWNYNTYSWYKEWRSGYFWYYTWSTQEIFVCP